MANLVVLVLQLRLRTLTSGANRLGVIAVEGPAGLGMVQLGAVLVVTGDEQGNAEGTGHDALLAVGTLTETQCQVTDSLGAALDAQGLVVVEGVALGLDAGVLDHAAGVGLKARHGAADVAVDLDNLLDRRCLEQGRRDSLLDAQHDTLACSDSDGGAAQLDGLETVFDLEEAAFGREGAARERKNAVSIPAASRAPAAVGGALLDAAVWPAPVSCLSTGQLGKLAWTLTTYRIRILP